MLRQLPLYSCLLLSVLLLTAGCQSGQDFSSVSGQVTMDGKPLADAIVAFDPGSGNRPAIGTTDADGQYQLQYTANQMGTAPGSYTVRISSAASQGEGQPQRRSPIPTKYNEQSELTVEVTPGTNRNVNFELQSK